jgi:hypothetical protein
MRRFLVEVSEQAFDRLAQIALTERRGVKDQAAWLLEHALIDGNGPEPPQGSRREEPASVR